MRLALASFLAASLALAGCAHSDVPAGSSSAQDVTGAPSSEVGNVTVESATLQWGHSAIYGGDQKSVTGVHAFLFAGEAGDAVTAKSSSDTPGTVYILEQTDKAFTVVAKSDVATGSTQGSVSAKLAASGSYAIAYEAKPAPEDPNAFFPASYSVSLTLAGTPSSAANKLVVAVRDAWDASTDYAETEKAFTPVAATKLPAAARAQFDEWNKGMAPDFPSVASTWAIGGSTVYVIENDNDGGMLIAFYDSAGGLIGSGGASEGEDFAWND